MIKATTALLIAGVCFIVILILRFLGSEQTTVGPIDVSIVDTNGHILPYVRVEVEDFKRGYKSEAQNFGRYHDGPFFEGKHRVIVKLGNHSDAMTEVVYDRVHDFTKDMKTLGINLENVRQRFNIEVAEQGVNIPVTQYADRKDIFIRLYEEGRWIQRKDISAPFELKILDDIEEIFHANILDFLKDFRCVTFVRQEYPTGKWIYHVIFTNLEPKPFNRTGGTYNFNFSTPNLSFSVSQDIAVMNSLTYSSPTLTMSGFTIVQTTFETKDFLPK